MVVSIAAVDIKVVQRRDREGGQGGEVTGQRRGRERDKSRVRASVESATERQRVEVNANGRESTGDEGARKRKSAGERERETRQ